MGKVVVLGVFVADTAFRADRLPRMGETLLGNSFALGPGGKGSNQAVACARMGADTHMLAKLGQDDFADMALSLWRNSGVTPHIQQVPDSYTGAAFVFIQEDTGDNAIVISPGAAATFSEKDVEAHRVVIESADVFMTQLEQPIEAAHRGLQIARDAGVTTILNPAPAAELPNEMLALCDYITPNETETEELTGITVETEEDARRAAQAFVDLGVACPIITLGERGAYLHGVGLVPAVNAGPVVETTGAGDAFNGAFAAAIAQNRSVETAVQIGCATAGLSVTKPGTAASMPQRADVDAILN